MRENGYERGGMELNENTPRHAIRSSLTSKSQPQVPRPVPKFSDLDEVRTSLLFDHAQQHWGKDSEQTETQGRGNHLSADLHEHIGMNSNSNSQESKALHARADTSASGSDVAPGRYGDNDEKETTLLVSENRYAETDVFQDDNAQSSDPPYLDDHMRHSKSSGGGMSGQMEISESYLQKLLAFKENEIELLQEENARLQESFLQSQSRMKQMRLEQVALQSEFELQRDIAARKIQDLARQEEDLRKELEMSQSRITELKETQDDYRRFVNNFEKKSENQDRERQEVSRRLDKKTHQFEDILKQNFLLQKQEARLKSRLSEVEASLLQENTKSNNLRLELEQQKNEMETTNRQLSHQNRMLERKLNSTSVENHRLQTGIRQTLSQLLDELHLDVFELNETMIYHENLSTRCRHLEVKFGLTSRHALTLSSRPTWSLN
eukprot:123113-Hanusia_phi.AAC.2